MKIRTGDKFEYLPDRHIFEVDYIDEQGRVWSKGGTWTSIEQLSGGGDYFMNNIGFSFVVVGQ